MAEYTLPPFPHFADGRFERDDPIRQDPARLAEMRASSRALFLPFDGLEPRVRDARLAFQPIAQSAQEQEELLFLAMHHNGAPIFCALPHNADADAAAAAQGRANWGEIALLNRDEAALYATARSIASWHANHSFCAKCGGMTQPAKGGWSRVCTACAAEHFPRVDPVVIMLARHNGRILLGRQPRFPDGQYSALAGFIEPGESMEDAVIRELYEEAGVRAHSVRYIASQPWPYPSNLMLGCIAVCDDDALTIDETELEHAFWAEKADVIAAFETPDSAPFRLPAPLAIAHHLISHWLAEQAS